MIIWDGLGFLVAVITFGCLLAMELIVESAFHDDRYYQGHGWPKLLGFVVAAALVGVLGLLLRRRQGRVLIDPQTGGEVIVGRHHTLFFIPVEYWAPILVATGLGFPFVTE